jgi:NAD(P)-dependent dehydrogenase (short-subunit alcohol dehydrogenase family)
MVLIWSQFLVGFVIPRTWTIIDISLVGGTSGIGESTARAFVKYAVSPRVYLVGRSETRASKILEDLRALNPDGQINFIKGDVSRLQEVDQACQEIQAKEEKINVLVLSAGIMTTKGRDGRFLVFAAPHPNLLMDQLQRPMKDLTRSSVFIITLACVSYTICSPN